VRFTVIGHSCLFFETRAGRILVDPWLLGSAGWRSWWHFPPTPELRPEWLAPDWLYLTHHHPDHFHYPSLRRIPRATRLLVPRFGVDVMKRELEKLGFSSVTELDHGEPRELAPGVEVASYQYGFDDTLFVVRDGEHVVFDVNDCKMKGPPLRQVLRRWGRPTVFLKGHSFAQAYPHCYRAEDPRDLELISKQTYFDDFIATARELGARYAIPFGSMVAFLHPESFHVNRHIVTPGDVAEAFAHASGVERTQLVPMIPGDTWDSSSGFVRSGFDWYGERERHLAELAEKVRPQVERALAAEAGRKLGWDEFARYFGAFLAALPPGVGGFLVPRPVVFHVPSAARPYFVLDLRRRELHAQAEPPAERATLITVPEAVLADAIEKKIVHIVHGSMRIQAELRPGGVSEDLAFWGLMMIWEIGYLPWTRLLSRRVLGVAWRRRREGLELARALRGAGSPLTRLSRRFAAIAPGR
jgi:UDP-MurNAc hydroxylase